VPPLDDEVIGVLLLPPVLNPPRSDALDRLVEESWERSVLAQPARARIRPGRALSDAEADRLLRHGPLAAQIGLARQLLEPFARSGSLVLTIADARARVLQVVGDDDARREAHRAGVRQGYDWSERLLGTNGVGTALASGRPVRVAGEQHYAPGAAGLVCWAVPVRNPATGDVVGVLDLTGAARSECGHELTVLVAAGAAIEARLALTAAQGLLLDGDAGVGTADGQMAELEVLGRRRALLHTAARGIELSERHSEIVLLLAWFAEGLSADELAHLLERGERDTVVVRAEIHRLRLALAEAAAVHRLERRPYRFVRPPSTDAGQVEALVRAGRLDEAVRRHAGGVLPGSDAPGVQTIRDDVARKLRTAVVATRDPYLILELARCPENRDDAELWDRCAASFVPGSPGRVEALAELERIDAELRA
jgi:transcriptional regulator of acetoin/glycerol metabolism